MIDFCQCSANRSRRSDREGHRLATQGVRDIEVAAMRTVMFWSPLGVRSGGMAALLAL